jgi:uncharacterized protein YeaO (DUF488 family)
LLVKVNRAQLRHRDKPGHVDVTVKSAAEWARPFAPTWDLVMGHKNGLVSDQEYTWRYESLLERNPLLTRAVYQLHQLGLQNGGSVTLCCYCKDGDFCHTAVLARYLAKAYPDQFTTDL